ncbi:MAG TPA: hypothetical protein VJ815_10345 [Acidimicrobiia bacterium]|nr:hypothetical protein [Acidimicrobiia bacterium]
MLEGLTGWRVVADPASLDELKGMTLRFAPDDALVLGEVEVAVGDPEAIVERDSGWVALRVIEGRALDLIATHALWRVPPGRPMLVQGLLAGLPAKVYLDGSESMIIVAAPFGHELEERLGT